MKILQFAVLMMSLILFAYTFICAQENLDFEHVQNEIMQAEKDSSDLDLSKAYQSMAQYYEAAGDHKNAATYFKKYITLHEQLISEQSDFRIDQLELRYEASQKEKELELLKKEQKLKESEVGKSRNERNMLIVISLLVLMLVIVFLNRYHMHSKLHKKLDELNKKLIDLTETDTLTNLYNRRFLLEKIDYLKLQFERTKIPFSILIGDLDDFKEVNDTYGHDVGDKILLKLGETITKIIRKQDFIGRWGGDEFILVLPETDEEGAQTIAYKIENIIAQTKFDVEKYSIKVGITFGFAEYDCLQDASDLVKKADISLYIRKEEQKQHLQQT